VIPAGAYFVGLAMVAAGTALSFQASGTAGMPIVLAAAGVALLVVAIPLFNSRFLKPIKKLKNEAERFASACLDGNARSGEAIDDVAHNLEAIQAELSESRLNTKELESTVNVFMAEKQQTEAILKSLPSPVLVTDRFEDLLLANDVAGRLFGFDSMESRGKPLSEILDFDLLVNLIKETSASKVKVPRRTVEVTFGNSDGEQVELRASLSSIIDPSGQILGVVTIIQDITKDKEIDRMKSEFVANVSHELKTPLSSIQAYVEMLVDGEAPDEETRQSFYSIIDSETKRLSSMIENLLNLSRLEAGVTQLEKERVSLHKVLEDVVQVLTPHVERKNQTLERDISSYLVPVAGDENYLTRVFTNLLSNASKYTPDKGTMKLKARLEGEMVRVDVIDTGYGISAEEKKKIFDSFYRVKGAASKAQGTGLGLAIARKIIEMQNGTITVESEPGKGSCFTVSLPAAE